MVLVQRPHRAAPVRNRRHVLADGDGLDRRHALPGRNRDEARLRDGAVLGIQPVVLDTQTGKEPEGNSVDGALVLKTPWP